MTPKDLGEWIEFRRGELSLIVIGVVFLGIGVLWWRSSGKSEPEIQILSAAEASGVATVSGTIMVDVGGAVKTPGVYKLSTDARVGDAIGEAGGITSQADTEWIEKYLNRSERVKDGMKIYIPKIQAQSPAGNEVGQAVDPDNVERVNINTASQSVLEELPGIGPVTAKKIIDGRPYGKTEDLASKKVVTAKVWEQIKDRVSLW